MDWKQLGTDFEYNKKVLEQAVTRLEKEAETIHETVEARRASQARIATARREIASLKGTKSDLFLEWQTAEFNDSQEVKKELKNKRRQIDERISELEEEVNAERIILDTQKVDKTHAAGVAAQRDTLKKINVGDFIKRLKAMLEEEVNELNSRIDGIRLDSSMYDREEYDRLRSGKDMSYAMQLSQHKRLAEKEKAKRAKMRPVSSTDEMHAIQSGNRKQPEDRMSVTAKGQKVKGYSERRVSHDEESDHSHVLSGQEIRNILAQKEQAKKAS